MKDNELLSFIDENNKLNKRKKKKKKQITIFFINILTITLLVGGGFGIKTILDQKKDYEKSDKLQSDITNLYSNISEEILDVEFDKQENKTKEINSDFDKLIDKNSDTIGWIKVNNTRIDLPVVQTDDNDYYLTHDFNKEYNSMGWVYGDYRNDFKNLDQNNILYGHTYKDTIMFSSLQYVLDDNWLNNKDNYIIEFNTLYENLNWEIFSIYTIPKTSDYLKVDFNGNEFINFIDMLKKRSIKDFDVQFNDDDKIITLSTCYINSKNRLVVHAKLIRN